jgi:hypothetical protein
LLPRDNSGKEAIILERKPRRQLSSRATVRASKQKRNGLSVEAEETAKNRPIGSPNLEDVLAT